MKKERIKTQRQIGRKKETETETEMYKNNKERKNI
jgi:hypothetical protein